MKRDSVISIVIRTLNEAKHLDRLLTAIHSQETPDASVELILVDSGSTDTTVDIARRHGCRVLTIRRGDFSFGRSLNIGCEASTGEYLVFVSGHCVPAGGQWLQDLCKPLVDGRASYAYGRQLGDHTTQFSEHQIFAKYFPDEDAIPQKELYCNNANAAILRDVWSEYRFDEDLTGLEDMHLAKRLMNDGKHIAYVARACVYHLHDESWQQVRRRFEREALALRQIMPEVHIRQRDVVRYIASSVLGDLTKAGGAGLLKQSLLNIFLYRVNQYIGSYLGNRVHQELSHLEKERLFYPDRGTQPTRPEGLQAPAVEPKPYPGVTSDD
jgi:glycosyltransferase involved in cell wall biosynthesis